ncbi:AraC family transcriptional regulator [Celerinatantimonas diazotrophica]|uniref:AraC family transcriptional regulator n=1 Tax=Celerinatantimonas diazotrophica TaxID=412034 RepID=A0A4R1K3W3_9GAMM|nr:AraC family transcriptional regulator [Celerinatantimonas diazotrophica]TCK58795.1 AraC family transcriptional regulator [Celerinatantimonas diazotrophica]CAG9297427.1 HTH-type transcriptional activator RhaS [Celerinatantimonas diazotrophica]
MDQQSALKSKERARFQVADELGGIELLDAQYERQNFSRHSHEGYTIGVIERGAQCFYRTGSNHVAPQDAIILVNADEMHTGHSAVEGGWAYKAMYPLPEQFQAINQELGNASYGAPYFPNAVVYDPELANQFRLVFNTLAQSENRMLRETLVYASLVKLMLRYGKTPPKLVETSKSQQQLMRVKEFLDDYPQADVSLEELAKLANISPFHLVRAFQKQFGYPPHAYQIQTRLRYARKLLKAGRSISDTAQDCGFHDQSHFHRHFKKAMGITPKQYIQH